MELLAKKRHAVRNWFILEALLKTVFAIICFGLAAAFAVWAIAELEEYWGNPEPPAAISAMLLLGAFLLLRRAPRPSP
jgi:hypothetical protein